MSSELLGNQPLGGTVSKEIAALFRNLGLKTYIITSLEFVNVSGDDDITVEVYQPDENTRIKIGQAVLDAGEKYELLIERRLSINDIIEARASSENTVQWRVNFRV